MACEGCEYRVQCQACGTSTDVYRTPSEAISVAVQFGWKYGKEVVCPACQQQPKAISEQAEVIQETGEEYVIPSTN